MRPRGKTTELPVDGAWRYERRRISRGGLALALILSAGMHATLLFGSKFIGGKTVVVKHVEEAPMIRLVLPPEIKELEEPERTASNDTETPPELMIPVPMQADVPQLVRPNDFVQPLDFASMLEQPDLNRSAMTVIPEHFARNTRLAETIGKIFNLDDLDRAPEPTLQPAPVYPISMRREGLSATVSVEFVVDSQGRVLEPVVFDSTHHAFDEAALAGVAKWKFRPGLKAGAKVNVRMRVPIVFKVLEGIE
jgi:protein TonB